MVKSSFLWFAAALILVLACASETRPKAPAEEGMMSARWTPSGGVTQSVPISWESSSSSHGTMHATLGKGGEHFNGKYVRIELGQPKAVVTNIYTDWNSEIWNGYVWDPVVEGEVLDYDVFVNHYSGKVLATLFGDRGNSMRCRFTLQDPERGLLQGGVGECQVSDGGKLDVEF